MSNYLAIATVTAALGSILQDAARVIPGATVMAKRPEQINSDGQEQPGINLFLYQVTPNPALSNADLPQRNAQGKFVQRPQVVLDLNYLFSFYGSEPNWEPQRLLSSALVALHTHAVLVPDFLQTVVENTPVLAGSNLSEQADLVRLSGPLNFSLEELSKLWSVLFRVPYTLSIAYCASAVFLDADVKIQTVKPVLERSISAQPGVRS